MLIRSQWLKMVIYGAAAGAVTAIIAAPADARVRQYSAKADSSVWQLTTNTRLACGITHTIPRYGEATFFSQASKKLNLDFELDMLRLPANYGLAAVTSVPPAWQPGVPSKTIATMSLKKQFNPDMPEKAAWTMLTELENGFNPTIYYADFYSPFDKVAVGLSAVNFNDTYFEFLTCVDNLLPYSFEDVSYTVLLFEKNSDELTKESKGKLKRIGEYLKHAPMVDELSVDAYSDSYGGRATNMRVSKRRGQKVADYLIGLGVDKAKVMVTGHGEKRHAVSNRTELGRMANRRVVVRMSKP